MDDQAAQPFVLVAGDLLAHRGAAGGKGDGDLVETVIAGHVAIVDQLAAKGGDVGVRGTRAIVDIALRVDAVELESFQDVLEDDDALLPLGGNLPQAFAVEEVAQNFRRLAVAR